ncbi:nucleoside kinase [Marinilabiliaceae bacterium ANBcel2]|nr:nucleoside kinase [Marinilabiliaceae bacterium ANBcel2]
MENSVIIKCLNNNKSISVSRGTSLKDIAEKLGVNLSNPILGAMVNNRLRELNYECFKSKTVKFIDITHPDGMRMYVRSLSFVLSAAVKSLYPSAVLRIEHSVSKGFYCELDKIEGELTENMVTNIYKKMEELIAFDYKFEKRNDETEKVIKMFESQGMFDKSELLRHRGQYYTSYYCLNNHVGIFYGFLVPSSGYLKVFDLNKYYKGMLLRVPKTSDPSQVEDLVIQNKLFDIFREYSQWNRILNVTKISDLNQSAENGKAATLIKVSEALHEKKIANIADKIASEKSRLKVVLISGPTSSGKTTFSKRLAIQLLVLGITPLTLSLDNYFVNRVDTPLDENGDYDFEAIEAIDLELFNNHLVKLMNGEEVEIPQFSFETGERFFNGDVMQMQKDNILIIEGIHGLNPHLTHLVSQQLKFKIYVSALTSINIDDQTRIPTTDNRLVRRIIRDYKYRNYSARETIGRWSSVRRGEEKHIFPFQEEADIMFNTALLYEFAVLKPFIEPILLEVQPNQVEYSEANRLLRFFRYFKPMAACEIPPTSILREFLGGSSFTY